MLWLVVSVLAETRVRVASIPYAARCFYTSDVFHDTGSALVIKPENKLASFYIADIFRTALLFPTCDLCTPKKYSRPRQTHNHLDLRRPKGK